MPLRAEEYSGKKSAFIVKLTSTAAASASASSGAAEDDASSSTALSSGMAVVLSAESLAQAEDWMETINHISRRLREQSFFPDELTYDDTSAVALDDVSLRIKHKSM